MSSVPASAELGDTAGARLLDTRQVHLDHRLTAADRLAVLVVDHPGLTRELTATLSGQPMDIVSSADPAEALFLVGRLRPDVVLLGPIAGRLSAVAAMEILHQQEPHLPIVVGVGPNDGQFAAHAATVDPAAIVQHPFRAEPLIRLLRSLAPAHVNFDVCPLPLDLGRLRIEGSAPDILLDGVRIPLPKREFLLLRCLAEQAGRVVSRADIGKAVWGSAAAGRTNTLSVHIMRLRRRLGDHDDGPQWITAVRGLGYRLTVPSREQVHVRALD